MREGARASRDLEAPLAVMPANAGIQQLIDQAMDSSLRGNDGMGWLRFDSI
jgi:hypothetical protein